MRKLLGILFSVLCIGSAFAQSSAFPPPNNVPLGPSAGQRGWKAVAPGATGNCLTSNSTTWTSAPCAGNTISVATIAALRALAPNAYPSIYIQGYTAAGDGGGGGAYWDSTNVTADNGCTIFQPDAGGTGRWVRYFDDIKVAYCGATGNQFIVDDAPAIRAAMDLATSFPNGGTVTAACGIRYTLGSFAGDALSIIPNRTGVRFQGCGSASTILEIANNMNSAKAITGITKANPAVVTTALPHGFVTGNAVCVSGVKGMVEVNGSCVFLTVLTSTTFQLNGIDSTGFTTFATKTVSAITRANPAVVTATAHGYSNGDEICVSGVSGMTQINGLCSIISSITTDTFTMPRIDSSAFTAYTSGGVASGGIARRQFAIFYPCSETIECRVDNGAWIGFTIDYNSTNNICADAGCYFQNVGIGVRYGDHPVVEDVTFLNNPGSQDISFGTNGTPTVTNASVARTYHFNPCDMVNPLCTDHSSLYMAADQYTVSDTICDAGTQSLASTCVEMHGTGTANNTVAENYQTGLNAVAFVTDGNISINGGQLTSVRLGVAYFARDSFNLSTGVTNLNGSLAIGSPYAFHDASSSIGTLGNVDITLNGGNLAGLEGDGNAVVSAGVRFGPVRSIIVNGMKMSSFAGRCIELGVDLLTKTIVNITNNILIDCGKTSTAANKQGIGINGAVTAAALIIANNAIINQASAFMTIGIKGLTPAAIGQISGNVTKDVATSIDWGGSGTAVGFTGSTTGGCTVANGIVTTAGTAC